MNLIKFLLLGDVLFSLVLEQNLRTHRPTLGARPTETPDAEAEAEEQMDYDMHVFRNGTDGGDFNAHVES